MEVILLHRPVSLLPPELMKAAIDLGKDINAREQQVVPGGKLVSSYIASNQMLIICLWDVPNIDSLIPVCSQMNLMGWNTEIIPVQKSAEAIPMMEQALAGMMKK